MSEERMKVLEMLSAGKISAAEAEQLLQKLEAAPASEKKDQRVIGWNVSKMKFLRIAIDKPGKDQVNVRVPLSFLRTGVKIASVLPASVAQRLRESGVNLEELNTLDGEHLEDALQKLNLHISQGNKTVQFFCE